MTEETGPATYQGTETRAGKYLTFVLADEEYGLEILKVREIMGMVDPMYATASTIEFQNVLRYCRD